MQPGDVFIRREILGAELRPDAVRFSSELSEEAKTAWFVLAMCAGVDDAAYPPLSLLQHLFGVGRVRSRRNQSAHSLNVIASCCPGVALHHARSSRASRRAGALEISQS